MWGENLLYQTISAHLGTLWSGCSLFFFQTKMETVQVFIKTEEDDEKEGVAAQYLLQEEKLSIEPVKSER